MPTKIEWTDETWNPITGCSHAGTPECDNCYARQMAQRQRGRNGYPADDPFRVTFHRNRLDQPVKWKKPRRIFVGSMTDMWHPDVDQCDRAAVIRATNLAPQHTYLWLTKRPELFDGMWADQRNFWLGVTCGHPDSLRRVAELLKCPAAKRFVSVEPLLGELDLTRIPQQLDEQPAVVIGTVLGTDGRTFSPCGASGKGIDWLILGPETGRNARPSKPEWFESLIGQADAAGIPVFIKAFPVGDKVSKDMAEWPKFAWRREFPDG